MTHRVHSSSRTTFTALRKEYSKKPLLEEDTDPDPFRQFQHWWEETLAAGVAEPNGMALATALPDGRPSVRIVLLKGMDERGFVFFTNYESRKGCELKANPHAALAFWWEPLERQVRIEGSVEYISAEESDGYFAERPRASQLGAWASPQSQIVESREGIEHRKKRLEAHYGAATSIPRPPHWGGFRVVPALFEFWQGRASRLHDRIRYVRDGATGWWRERLAP